LYSRIRAWVQNNESIGEAGESTTTTKAWRRNGGVLLVGQEPPSKLSASAEPPDKSRSNLDDYKRAEEDHRLSFPTRLSDMAALLLRAQWRRIPHDARRIEA
jgi:hypothetical protein